jgi:hypothetical protein
MRGTNGPMDVITRAELEDSMKNFPTKDQLEQTLADDKSRLASTVRAAMKESVEDLKVDLLDALEQKVATSHRRIVMDAITLSELEGVKVEILAATRRNINDAVAPLVTKAEFEARLSKIDESHDTIHKSHDAMHKSHAAINKSIKELTHFVTAGLGVHENRLKDQEASS